MSDVKTELLEFFKENPSKVGLAKFWGGWGYGMLEGYTKLLEFDYLPGWSFERVAQSEDGEDCYVVYSVYKISRTNTYPKVIEPFYVKFYGYHRSHDGTYYTGWKEVKPTVVTKEVFG